MKPSKSQNAAKEIAEQNKAVGYGQTRKNGPIIQSIKIAASK